MKFAPVLLTFFFLPVFLSAQSNDDELEIAGLIQTLFDGMRAADTAVMSPLFIPGARLQSVYLNKEGQTVISEATMQDWLNGVGTPHDKVFDEKIWSMDILIDGQLANAWTDYTFYLGEDPHHCGINSFQLVKKEGKWLVYQVTDTRRNDGCITEANQLSDEIHTMLNNWHQAAATADADGFFGAMTEDAIYLGTDATERWLRDELREWAKAAFEKDVAWAFTSSDRVLYFTSDQKTAWFEENLKTGMGTCRGSGVVQKVNGEWKLKHYNLALLLPNEKLDEFRELVGAGE